MNLHLIYTIIKRGQGMYLIWAETGMNIVGKNGDGINTGQVTCSRWEQGNESKFRAGVWWGRASSFISLHVLFRPQGRTRLQIVRYTERVGHIKRQMMDLLARAVSWDLLKTVGQEDRMNTLSMWLIMGKKIWEFHSILSLTACLTSFILYQCLIF